MDDFRRDAPPSIDRNVRFRLEAISKTYPGRDCGGRTIPIAALDGVNLPIYENRVNAIVGESGSGKSTLCRILMRLEKSDSGCIRYKNLNEKEIPLKEFRRQNQIAFQNPYLAVNPHFTIGKIVAEPLVIAKTPKEEIARRMKDLFALLEIPESIMERHPGSLSGGQMQRVVLARALMLEPEFLVLDEPFSAIDDILAVRLLLLFQNIFRTKKIGVLYVSHDLRRVRIIADSVSLLHQGRVLEHQDRESFFSSPRHPVARQLVALTTHFSRFSRDG